jgi:hypothetical protein
MSCAIETPGETVVDYRMAKGGESTYYHNICVVSHVTGGVGLLGGLDARAGEELLGPVPLPLVGPLALRAFDLAGQRVQVIVIVWAEERGEAAVGRDRVRGLLRRGVGDDVAPSARRSGQSRGSRFRRAPIYSTLWNLLTFPFRMIRTTSVQH